MAVATNFEQGRTILNVASLDADWSYLTTLPDYNNGVRTISVQYVPSGKGDVFILKNASSNGPDICYCSSLNNFETKYFYGKRIKPLYDVSDRNYCTASATSKVIFVFGM